MENICKMEMASALFEKECIKVEKAFFGLKTNVTYTPTNSPMVGLCLDYDPMVGQKVKLLVGAPIGEMEKLVAKEGCPCTCANGNFRLSLCYSKDRSFVALQLAQYSNFVYKPVSEIRFIEGAEACKAIAAFVK